jgi:hypothetical protein
MPKGNILSLWGKGNSLSLQKCESSPLFLKNAKNCELSPWQLPTDFYPWLKGERGYLSNRLRGECGENQDGFQAYHQPELLLPFHFRYCTLKP